MLTSWNKAAQQLAVRTLSTSRPRSHPTVEEIHKALVAHSSRTTAPPMACNFISQVFDPWAEDPTRLALRCLDQETGEQTEITYAEVAQRSHAIATYFQSQGLGKGNPVALMLGQRPAWWYSVAGLMRAGIPIVPCPRLLTSGDLAYRIQDLGIRGIVAPAELQDRIDAIRSQCPSLAATVTTGVGTPHWASIANISARQTRSALPASPTTTADPAVYLYTSGTTGQPKAVEHYASYPFVHWPTGQRWLRATSSDLIYNASDTGWGFTLWITLAAWSMGSKLLITPTNAKFRMEEMLTTLREQPIDIFCAAPTVLRLLVADPRFSRIDFPKLRRIVTVGEALDETVIKQFAERGVEIAVGFGQAETPLLMGRVDGQSHVPGTMGQPISPYKVVALDEEFKPVSLGNVGQIAVDLKEGSSLGIMRRYVNASEKTEKTRSPDGRYYLTGDYALHRLDGFFSYQGRRDDLIKSRGYRIGPDEVEKAGMSHPAVAKIAVIGVRTQTDSAAITVKAFILLKPGYTETETLLKDIQDRIKAEIEPQKHPRLIECLTPEEWASFETISGKIRRAGLRVREEARLVAQTPENNSSSSAPKPKMGLQLG